MNKEDILEKSRKENKNGDEREEKIRLKSYALSAAIGGLICMVFVFIESVVFDRSTSMIWSIYSCMMFSKALFDGIKLKKMFDICMAIIWGLCFIVNTIVYILNNVG